MDDDTEKGESAEKAENLPDSPGETKQRETLQKKLDDLRAQFDAGKITSEVYLKKKKVPEKRFKHLEAAGVKKPARSGIDKASFPADRRHEKKSIKESNSMMHSKQFFIFVGASIVLLGLVVWGIIFLLTGTATGFDVDMRAPGFTLLTVDDAKVSLSDFKDKKIVLTFWDKPESCKDEASSLKDISRALPSDKVGVIAVNIGADVTATRDCIRSQGVTYPVLIDPQRDIARLYGVTNFPKTFFIDEKGIIVQVRFGSLSDKEDVEAVFRTADSNQGKKGSSVSNVTVSSLTQTSAVLMWTTKDSSGGSVTTTDGKRLTTIADNAITTNHIVALSNLLPGNMYTLKLVSKDNAGKESITEGYSLRTLRDTAPPVISGATVTSREATSVTVSWTTDEPATTQVEFGETAAYGGVTTLDTMLITGHNVVISGLKPETTYYLKVRSKDMQGNESVMELNPVATKSAFVSGAEVGMKAPDFTMTAIDGSTVKLSGLRGKIVILQFFNTECRSCAAEMPLIRKTYLQWSGKGLQLFAVTSETHVANLKMFATIYNLPFPILMDVGEKVNEAYRVPFTPYFVFIDGNGVIKAVHEGRFTNEEDLTNILNSLFYPDGNAPKKPDTGGP